MKKLIKLPPNCQKWKFSFSYLFFALSMSYWAYMPKMLFVDQMGWLEANTKTKSKNSEQKWKKKHDSSSPFRDFVVPRFSPSSRSGPITVDTNTVSSPLSIHAPKATGLHWCTCTGQGHLYTGLACTSYLRAVFFPTVLEPTFFVMESWFLVCCVFQCDLERAENKSFLERAEKIVFWRFSFFMT